MAGMRWLLPCLLILAPSCSLFRDPPETDPDAASKPRLVGRIAHVPAAGDFVLIEAYGPWRVPEGGLLTGVGTEGRTANLVATGEKLGQHAAADVRSGLAKVGDSVYYRPLGGGEDDETSPTPAPEGASTTDAAQKTESPDPAKP